MNENSYAVTICSRWGEYRLMGHRTADREEAERTYQETVEKYGRDHTITLEVAGGKFGALKEHRAEVGPE